MNRLITLTSERFPQLSLRAICVLDQENLRIWKNQHRHLFFFTDLISVDDQHNWFQAYLVRDQDYMFMVVAEGLEIGCMGFRLQDHTWDIYNVILGVPAFSKKGYMGQALQVMCSFALSVLSVSVSAKVLTTNPAIAWYVRNGFVIVKELKDHVQIELDLSLFSPASVSLIS